VSGLDYAGAVADGVLVVDPHGYSSDGDAYTLESVVRPPPTGPPVLSTLTPSSVAIASLPSDVTIDGSGFTRDCRVLFGGATPLTQYVSESQLRVRIDPGPWSAGAVDIAVTDGKRGVSNALPLTLT
jgi:hypothetical protein